MGFVAAVMASDQHSLRAGGFELLELGELDGVSATPHLRYTFWKTS